MKYFTNEFILADVDFELIVLNSLFLKVVYSDGFRVQNVVLEKDSSRMISLKCSS